MALVFSRKLAIPLWAVAFVTIAVTGPQAVSLLLTMVLAMAVMVMTMPGRVPWLLSARPVAQVLSRTSRRRRHKRRAAAIVAAGACVRTLDKPSADDALDLVRMDDDGGWQVARPPA